MIKRSRGFTIIELLVVISVIGILSTITLIGFNRYQADSRDTERSSRATVLAEALEKYYDKHGEYPSCSTMQNATTAEAALPGIDPSVLVTPEATAGDQDSIDLCTTLTTAVTTDSFAYVGDGSASCISGGACLDFTLQYKQESTGTIASIEGRRNTNINTSGSIGNLGATTTGFTQISLTWGAISNAYSYTVQSSPDNTFATPTTLVPDATTNSATVTSLNSGHIYFFRVRPNATGSTGTWSNIANATTWTWTTPVATATPNSASQITISWPSVPHAVSYTVQMDGTGTCNFTSPTQQWTTSTLSQAATGLSLGTTYCFQVQAIDSPSSSPWSNSVTSSPIVPVPTGVTATANTSTQVTVSWTAVSGATSYVVDYSTDSAFASPAPTTTLTATSGKITGIGTNSAVINSLQEGGVFYFRVYALVNTISSLPSSSATATTPIDPPAAYTISSSTSGYYLNATSNAVCPSGTVGYYTWYANSSLWEQGTAYQSVGYYVDYGQSYTLTVTTQCNLGSVYSTGTAATNNASWTRGAPATPPALNMGGITRSGTHPCASGPWIVGCTGTYYDAADPVSSGGGCSDTTTYYNITGSYNGGSTAGGTQSNQTYFGTWYIIQPISGYIVKFATTAWCQAADGVTSTGTASNQACIADPSNSQSCF